MQSVANHLCFNRFFFITKNYLLEMIRKIIFTNYFSEFIYQVAIKFNQRFREICTFEITFIKNIPKLNLKVVIPYKRVAENPLILSCSLCRGFSL